MIEITVARLLLWCYPISTSVPPIASWNFTGPVYDGSDSTWFSSTLQRDTYADYTSYDWTYMNSYSYDASTNNVLKWDYAYNNWNFTSTDMGGFLAQDGQVQMSTDSPVLMAGLGCAALTIIGVAANKHKKAKSKSDDFVFESTAVDKVQIA